MSERTEHYRKCDRCGREGHQKQIAEEQKRAREENRLGWVYGERLTILDQATGRSVDLIQGYQVDNGLDLCPACAEILAQTIKDYMEIKPPEGSRLGFLVGQLLAIVMRDPWHPDAPPLCPADGTAGPKATSEHVLEAVKARMEYIFGEAGTKLEAKLTEVVHQLAAHIGNHAAHTLSGASSHSKDEPAVYVFIGDLCVSEHADQLEADLLTSRIRTNIQEAILRQGRAYVQATMTGQAARLIDARTFDFPEERERL